VSKRALAAHAALLAALALAGCGSDIDSGYVTKKIYEREWVETQYDRVCTAYGTNGMCKTWINMPRTINHPPQWRLDLKQGDKTGYVYVAQLTFDRYQVGDHYPEPR